MERGFKNAERALPLVSLAALFSPIAAHASEFIVNFSGIVQINRIRRSRPMSPARSLKCHSSDHLRWIARPLETGNVLIDKRFPIDSFQLSFPQDLGSAPLTLLGSANLQMDNAFTIGGRAAKQADNCCDPCSSEWPHLCRLTRSSRI